MHFTERHDTYILRRRCVMARSRHNRRAGRQQSAAGSPARHDPAIMHVPLPQVAAELSNVKTVWSQHSQSFTTWWNNQNKESRLASLLAWCPWMPLARDKPYLYVEGKKEDMPGPAKLLPEWNQSALVKGSTLVDLIKATAEIPDAGEPGSSPGYDAIALLCLQNLHLARQLAASGLFKSSLPPKQQRLGRIWLRPGRLGQTYAPKHMVPNIQELVDDGQVVSAREWELLIYRLDLHLSSMLMCLDHYRVDVLGRGHYQAIAPIQGCAKCGAVERNDGSNSLLSCSGCGMFFYCSEACQKAHWDQHKAECKEIAALKAAEASSKTTVAGKATGWAGWSVSGRLPSYIKHFLTAAVVFCVWAYCMSQLLWQ